MYIYADTQSAWLEHPLFQGLHAWVKWYQHVPRRYTATRTRGSIFVRHENTQHGPAHAQCCHAVGACFARANPHSHCSLTHTGTKAALHAQSTSCMASAQFRNLDSCILHAFTAVRAGRACKGLPLCCSWGRQGISREGQGGRRSAEAACQRITPG